MAIIKADAYGHGALFVARTLEALGIKKFGVATFTEGLELRQQGIRSEIHILNGFTGPISEYLSNRLYPVIYNFNQLEALQSFINEEKRDFNISLKFDTGMGRLGFLPSDIYDIIKIRRQSAPHIQTINVMTHLARADEEDQEPTDRQYTLFRKLRSILTERGLPETNFSICNSAALIDGKLEDYQWVRPGIALYGCYPSQRQRQKIDLKPVLGLKTKSFSSKKLSPGSSVG